MRTIPEVKDAIVAAEDALRALYGELDAVMREREKEMIQRFDAGESFAQIGRAVGLPNYTIKNILWRAGKTVKGREALRASHKILSGAGAEAPSAVSSVAARRIASTPGVPDSLRRPE